VEQVWPHLAARWPRTIIEGASLPRQGR